MIPSLSQGKKYTQLKYISLIWMFSTICNSRKNKKTKKQSFLKLYYMDLIKSKNFLIFQEENRTKNWTFYTSVVYGQRGNVQGWYLTKKMKNDAVSMTTKQPYNSLIKAWRTLRVPPRHSLWRKKSRQGCHFSVILMSSAFLSVGASKCMQQPDQVFRQPLIFRHAKASEGNHGDTWQVFTERHVLYTICCFFFF